MRTVKVLLATGAVLGLTATALIAAPAAQAVPPITIWTDAVHAPVISALLANGYRGAPVSVVTKDLTAIRDELAVVPAASAPDLIWADATWTGQLAAVGSIVPVPLTKKVTASFRTSALSGFQVGTTGYGMPVQVSNLALITNVALVPSPPTTFADLSSTALALTSAGKAKVPFAVGQGGDSDGYAMYPMFSGLGGYYFGKTVDGVWDPTDVGLANRAFLKNSVLIDSWNASGLINAALTAQAAQRAFAKQKSPFWLAGPEDMAALLKLNFVYRITAVPPIVASLKTSPLLRLQGFMVTKYAAEHGVQALAAKLAGGFMAQPGAQLALAGVAGLIPANRTAVAQVVEKRLQAIDLAGVDGVPIPNIPQMSQVWGPSGTAWVTSTAGVGATLAKPAFKAAQKAVKAALGQ